MWPHAASLPVRPPAAKRDWQKRCSATKTRTVVLSMSSRNRNLFQIAVGCKYDDAAVASRVVCKLKGPLTPVLIKMLKHSKDNSFKALRMSHDPHRSSSSPHFTKGSFD